MRRRAHDETKAVEASLDLSAGTVQLGDALEALLSMIPDAPAIIQRETTSYIKDLETRFKHQ